MSFRRNHLHAFNTSAHICIMLLVDVINISDLWCAVIYLSRSLYINFNWSLMNASRDTRGDTASAILYCNYPMIMSVVRCAIVNKYMSASPSISACHRKPVIDHFKVTYKGYRYQVSSNSRSLSGWFYLFYAVSIMYTTRASLNGSPPHHLLCASRELFLFFF